MRRAIKFLTCLAACSVASACSSDSAPLDDDPDASVDAASPRISTDPLEGLPTGPDSLSALCAKGYGDRVSSALCSQTPPTITSLADLRVLVDLEIDESPQNPNVRFTLLGHSTAIGGRLVTPINPRAFFFDRHNGTTPQDDFAILAFARGETFVELVAKDPSAGGALRFFLFRFELACESSQCSNADLFGPAVEQGWTGYSVYDDEDVANTILDCKSCHQPDGPGTAKILRMQELDEPWAHWFYEEFPANLAQMQDFFAIREGEPYAGIPIERVQPSRPFALKRLIENNGFANQPNEYPSRQIDDELAQGPTSPTWEALYAEAVAGRQIAVPYHGIPQTDPAKVATAITAYRNVIEGLAGPETMPDLSDVVLDSALRDMSIRPKAGLNGRQILQHMCQHCHNSTLDSSLTRARFNVESLDTLDETVKQEAVRRLMLTPDDRKKMPPTRFHELSDAELQLVVDELTP